MDVPQKADYDVTLRQAVLDRLLRDRLNIEQTKAAMHRDFLVTLSEGFVYDCLRWQLARLDLAGHHQMVLERFSGTLCVDELHLGSFTCFWPPIHGPTCPLASPWSEPTTPTT